MSQNVFSETGQWRSEKILAHHLERLAVVYVRQSTMKQVLNHQESTRLQYSLVRRAEELGWPASQILVIDDDLGKSASTTEGRVGFQQLVAEVSLDHVGLILGLDISRLSRSSKDWHQLLELCALFKTLISDLDGVYDPSQFNDQLLLGFSGFAFRELEHVGIHNFMAISGLNPFTLPHCGPSPPCVRFADIVTEADATLSTWRLAKASRMGTFTPQTKPSFARRTQMLPRGLIL